MKYSVEKVQLAVKPYADQNGNSENIPDLKHLIQSVQRLEGNPDCYGKADKKCDRMDCSWREYCLEEPLKDRHVKV